MGLNIIWTGWHLVAQSVDGLMDRALSPEEHDRLQLILDDFDSEQVRFHSVQTRVAGHARFISLHVLLPGAWTIQRGHDLVEDVEGRLVAEFDHAQVFTHMEPIEDPRSYEGDQPGMALRNGADRLPGTDRPHGQPNEHDRAAGQQPVPRSRAIESKILNSARE